MEKEISLIFPQWQGYGLSTKLADGARLIASQLSSSYTCATVAVELREDLTIQNGILGYASILRQLDYARSLLLEENPSRILTVGGDCGVEVAPISFLNHRYDQSITVIWLDAHGDLNTPMLSPSGHFHGMPLRVLMGDGDLPSSFDSVGSDSFSGWGKLVFPKSLSFPRPTILDLLVVMSPSIICCIL